ncbi:MAG: hypothetical protein K2M97_00165 [Muribaculaceae bacterium]|nr:hypothetical protein [Muribaculaceae bacterium]
MANFNSDDDRRHPGTPQVMRNVFGIFMIIIYIGMAVLLLLNFFEWPETTGWLWGRYTAAVLFMCYGVWRGIRQFKGIDSNI